MDSKQKTLVILDTNKIRNNFEWERDYAIFEPKGDFLKIIDFVETNKLENLVFIGIPEIVLEEIVTTRCENFHKQVENLKSCITKLISMPCCDFSNMVLPKDDYNYREFIKKKIEEYIENKKFILFLRLEKELYPRTLELLIEKATQKEKPFNESKKGFKDALIWEIILNFKDIDEYFSIFVLSENEKDFDLGLQTEFKRKFSKDLNLEYDTNMLIVALEDIYGLHIKYPKILAYLKTEYFKEQLENYLSENYELEINNFGVKNILEIEELNTTDLEDFELTESHSTEDTSDLKKISIIFENNKKEFKADFVLEKTSNELVSLNYEEREITNE